LTVIATFDVNAGLLRDFLDVLPDGVKVIGNSLPCSPGSLRLLLDVTETGLPGGPWDAIVKVENHVVTAKFGPRASPEARVEKIVPSWEASVLTALRSALMAPKDEVGGFYFDDYGDGLAVIDGDLNLVGLARHMAKALKP
jgi:hypothetical protein